MFKGGKDKMFRIHGINDASSIGEASSEGRIRLFNQDILDLDNRVPPDTRVAVLAEMQAGQATTPPPPGLQPTPMTFSQEKPAP